MKHPKTLLQIKYGLKKKKKGCGTLAIKILEPLALQDQAKEQRTKESVSTP